MANSKQAKDWKGAKFTGTVIYTKLNDDCSKGFAFIKPDGATDRSENVWFGSSALQGISVEKGDVVTFVYTNGKHLHEKGPSAYRVWVTEPAEQIMTHHGADEYR
jgi:cold shock CspA family protein